MGRASSSTGSGAAPAPTRRQLRPRRPVPDLAFRVGFSPARRPPRRSPPGPRSPRRL